MIAFKNKYLQLPFNYEKIYVCITGHLHYKITHKKGGIKSKKEIELKNFSHFGLDRLGNSKQIY